MLSINWIRSGFSGFSSVSNNRFAVPSLWMPGRRSDMSVLHDVILSLLGSFVLGFGWSSVLLAHTHTLRPSLVPSPRSFSTDFFPFAWKRRLLGQWLLGSSISTPKVPRFHLVLNYFPPPGNSHLFPPSPALLDQVLYLERLATFYGVYSRRKARRRWVGGLCSFVGGSSGLWVLLTFIQLRIPLSLQTSFLVPSLSTFLTS